MRKYLIALYIRLSLEDVKTESMSIIDFLQQVKFCPFTTRDFATIAV